MHVVVDTNIFISGLLASKACRKVFSFFKEEAFGLDISEIMFEELKFVIERPKFRLLINEKEKREVLFFIKHRVVFIRPKEKINICRDAKDNKILECALEAKSECIISGDKDLLSLEFFHKIPIITPRQFLKYLKK